jgi:hypothetical protein
MALFKPFDFNPQSVTVKTNTSNEAIGAGKFAYVIADVINGKFFIDDNAAIENENTIYVNHDMQPSVTTAFTCPADRSAEVVVHVRDTDNFKVSVQSAEITFDIVDWVAATAGQHRSSKLILGPSDNISASFLAGDDGITLIAGHYINMPARTQGFWIPTGTNLRVSGDARYTIQEYLIPT